MLTTGSRSHVRLLVVVADRAGGRVREPVQRHLLQHLLGRDQGGPVAEALEQLGVGELADRAVGQAGGDGLRTRAVHRVVAADGLEPLHVLERGVLLRAETLELRRVPRGEGEQLQHVRAEEALGVEDRQLATDHRAAVGAVHAVRRVAQAAHQLVVGASDARHRPAAVDDRGGEPEAGHRGDDEVEAGVGQRADERQELEERAGVGVGQEQRTGSRHGRLHVDEVDGLSVDLGQVVGVGVDPGLDLAPVEVLPALDHVAQVRRRGAVVPRVAGRGRGEPGVVEAAPQVVDLGLVDGDGERGDLGDGHVADATRGSGR